MSKDEKISETSKPVGEANNYQEEDGLTYICVDNSGSTHGSIKYWEFVIKTLEYYKKKSNYRVIFWSHVAQFDTFENAISLAKSRKGLGGTDPTSFVSLIKNCNHLMIITDGEIFKKEIKDCAKLLRRLNVTYNSIEIHFFKTSGEVNLSVAAPFTKSTKFKVYFEGDLIQSGDTSRVIDFMYYADKPIRFLEDFDDLHGCIIMKNLGSVNIQMRNAILNLQSKLFKHITKTNSKDTDVSISEMLKNGNYDQALEVVTNIYAKADIQMQKEIVLCIQKMISACDLSNQYSLDLLNPTRVKRARVIEPVNVSEIESYEVENVFECPISCDDDVPCLLLREGDPAFDILEMKEKQSALTCPLFVLHNDKFKEAVIKRLDHVIGLKSVKEIVPGVSPYSREPVKCAFVLGDHNCDKAVDTSLASLLFGRKLAGQTVLWLYVLYRIVKEREYLASNEDFMKSFEKYLIRRLTTTSSRITLSGLPIAPDVVSTLDVAAWYCIVSPYVVGKNTVSEANRLRALSVVGVYLIDIVDMLGYPYNREETYEMLSLWKAFSWMMKQERQKTNWRMKLLSHYQGTVVLSNGAIIPIDGPVTNPVELPRFELIEGQKPLTINQLYYLSTIVDISSTVGNVPVDIDLSRSQTLPDIKYLYDYDPAAEFPNTIEISPVTMRPYATDRKSGLFWRKEADKISTSDRRLSAFKRFTDCVIETKRFPSKDEFIEYIYRKEKMSEALPRETLPEVIIKIVDYIFKLYQGVCGDGFTKVNVEDFRSKVVNSYPLYERFLLDGSPMTEFPDDV